MNAILFGTVLDDSVLPGTQLKRIHCVHQEGVSQNLICLKPWRESGTVDKSDEGMSLEALI
jgi:hypothetical protein